MSRPAAALFSSPLLVCVAEHLQASTGRGATFSLVISAIVGASSVRSRTTTFQGWLLLLVAVWTASCGASGEPETRFEVLLKVAERLSAAGAVTAIPVEELSAANRARGHTVGRFTDGGLHFGVVFLSSQIQFEITNRNGTPATIPWDSTVYLDADGNEHRGFSSREEGRSAIGPGERLLVLGAPTDFTTPVDNGFGLTGILQPPPSVDPVLLDALRDH